MHSLNYNTILYFPCKHIANIYSFVLVKHILEAVHLESLCLHNITLPFMGTNKPWVYIFTNGNFFKLQVDYLSTHGRDENIARTNMKLCAIPSLLNPHLIAEIMNPTCIVRLGTCLLSMAHSLPFMAHSISFLSC